MTDAHVLLIERFYRAFKRGWRGHDGGLLRARIRASFRSKDGLIAEHRDEFSFPTWERTTGARSGRASPRLDTAPAHDGQAQGGGPARAVHGRPVGTSASAALLELDYQGDPTLEPGAMQLDDLLRGSACAP